jgi:hypothetical protein
MSQSLNPDYQGKKKSTKPLSDAEMIAAAAAKHEEQFVEQSAGIKVPSEIVELPSKGKLYPDGHPLRAGKIEMKYMTAREEDILTNQSYIKNGVVLDKLFQALILTKFDYNDLLLCDKNAIMVAARVLGYGKDYPITVTSPYTGEEVEYTVDLTTINEREIDWSKLENGKNEFEFELPASKRKVTFSLLTHGMQKKIDAEQKAIKKLKKDATLTTMLKYIITSIDGDTSDTAIRKFVDRELFAIDSRAFRQHVKSVTPDLDLVIEVPDGESGDTFRSSINIGLDFFWPDTEI